MNNLQADAGRSQREIPELLNQTTDGKWSLFCLTEAFHEAVNGGDSEGCLSSAKKILNIAYPLIIAINLLLLPFIAIYNCCCAAQAVSASILEEFRKMQDAVGGREAFLALPILNVPEQTDDSQEIDFIKPSDMAAPVMRGADPRPFIALKFKNNRVIYKYTENDEVEHVIDEGVARVITFFQRYRDETPQDNIESWVTGKEESHWYNPNDPELNAFGQRKMYRNPFSPEVTDRELQLLHRIVVEKNDPNYVLATDEQPIPVIEAPRERQAQRGQEAPAVAPTSETFRKLQEAIGGRDAFERLPVLNIDPHRRRDYIDFINPSDMKASIMKGADPRPFIAIKYKEDDNKVVVTFFQRYTHDNSLWAVGKKGGTYESIFGNLISDETYKMIREIVDGVNPIFSLAD